MANTIIGRIYDIKPTETREYNNKTYYERQVTIDATKFDPYTGEQMYPNYPQVSFSGEEKCRELEGFKNGEVVIVSFEVRGAKYNDKNSGEEKIFNKVQGYKIERHGQSAQQATLDTAAAPETAHVKGADDLPF